MDKGWFARLLERALDNLGPDWHYAYEPGDVPTYRLARRHDDNWSLEGFGASFTVRAAVERDAVVFQYGAYWGGIDPEATFKLNGQPEEVLDLAPVLRGDGEPDFVAASELVTTFLRRSVQLPPNREDLT